MSASWLPLATADGSWTLVSSALDEACHSRAGAWQQARLRYADGCRLRARAESGERSVLRVLDVGTGLGLNVAAALEATHASGLALEVLSLERDPDVIGAGCRLYEDHSDAGAPWEHWHRPVRSALRAALASPGTAVTLGERSTLDLRIGDARVELERSEWRGFDAVFLDPFSPRRAPELWGEAFLARIAERMASGAWLATYSAAFAVRLALARSGLHVGQGPRVGSKAEGTLAARDVEPPPLPQRVSRKLARALAGPRDG